MVQVKFTSQNPEVDWGELRETDPACRPHKLVHLQCDKILYNLIFFFFTYITTSRKVRGTNTVLCVCMLVGRKYFDI